MKDKAKQSRKKRNKEIGEALRKGKYIQAPFNKELSWFPPRPIIKKDKKEMERIYGKENQKKKADLRIV